MPNLVLLFVRLSTEYTVRLLRQATAIHIIFVSLQKYKEVFSAQRK